MIVEIDEISPYLILELRTCKKHNYDNLMDEYQKAKRNNHKQLQWQGIELNLHFANHLIEYLSPRFKDIR